MFTSCDPQTLAMPIVAPYLNRGYVHNPRQLLRRCAEELDFHSCHRQRLGPSCGWRCSRWALIHWVVSQLWAKRTFLK